MSDVKVFTTDGSGGLSLIKEYTGWSSTWDIIYREFLNLM